MSISCGGLSSFTVRCETRPSRTRIRALRAATPARAGAASSPSVAQHQRVPAAQWAVRQWRQREDEQGAMYKSTRAASQPRVAPLRAKKAGDEIVETFESALPNTNQDSTSGYTIPLIIAFVLPALAGALFGYDIGASSGAIVNLTNPELSGTSWGALTPYDQGAIVSGSLLGALGGSLFGLTLGDRLGRKKELLIACSCYIFGGILTYFTSSVALLILSRVIYGLGIGCAMHAAPMYIAEISTRKTRGTLVSLKEAFIVAGILVGYLVSKLFIEDVGGWRTIYGLSCPAALVIAMGMLFFLPESPRWLLLKSKNEVGLVEQAKASLTRLRGNIVPKEIDQEVSSVLDAIKPDDKGSSTVSWSETFRGGNRAALTVGLSLILFQQITGQPSVLYFATQIFQNAGFAAVEQASSISVFLGLIKLVMTGIAVVTVESLGRRPLLLVGVAGMIVSLFVLGISSSLAATSQGFAIAAVVALLAYVSCYQVSFGPITWLMVSEIFPIKIRARATGLATILNFGSNMMIAFALPPIQAAVGQPWTFTGFGIIGILCWLYMYNTVPETKGKTLEEIEADFQKK